MPPLLAGGDRAATLSPMSTEDRTSTPSEASGPERRRPTAWIIACAVLAIAVIGLAIWAFAAQSDADDTQAKLDAAQRAANEATPTPQPAQGAEVDPETRQQFEQIAQDLGATGETLDDIQQAVDQAAAKLDDAQQARADASGAIDAAKADAEAFKAQFELTRECLRGTLDAVGAAYGGGGVEAAVQELQKLAGSCRSAASS
jgi:hypothetical protein